MVREDAERAPSARARLNHRLRPGPGSPGPGIAKPQVRQNMQRRRGRSAVEGLDTNGNVFRSDLGVLDEDVKIALLVKDTRVEQIEFISRAAAIAVFRNETAVGKLRLRVLVQEL